ncbi:MAG: hypothetical protein V8R49_00905 [Duodenibacillus massiliensis]
MYSLMVQYRDRFQQAVSTIWFATKGNRAVLALPSHAAVRGLWPSFAQARRARHGLAGVRKDVTSCLPSVMATPIRLSPFIETGYTALPGAFACSNSVSGVFSQSGGSGEVISLQRQSQEAQS